MNEKSLFFMNVLFVCYSFYDPVTHQFYLVDSCRVLISMSGTNVITFPVFVFPFTVSCLVMMAIYRINCVVLLYNFFSHRTIQVTDQPLEPDLVFPLSPGVYFDSCVRQIKFVDFCGKYRLPLMHYLCSPECTSPCSSNPQSDADSEDESSVPAHRLQRVLLG